MDQTIFLLFLELFSLCLISIWTERTKWAQTTTARKENFKFCHIFVVIEYYVCILAEWDLTYWRQNVNCCICIYMHACTHMHMHTQQKAIFSTETETGYIFSTQHWMHCVKKTSSELGAFLSTLWINRYCSRKRVKTICLAIPR